MDEDRVKELEKEIEEYDEVIADVTKPLEHLYSVIDYHSCELSHAKIEVEDIMEEVKEMEKEKQVFVEELEKIKFEKYLEIPWYKCIITPGQTVLEIEEVGK